MNLATAKQLAELKEQQTALSTELGEKIEQKILKLKNQAFKDFETFFKAHSFEISYAEYTIEATYKTLNAKLCHNDQSVPLIGVYLRFDLTLHLSEQKEDFVIFLNPKTRTTHISASFSNLNDDEQALSLAQKTLERTKTRINTFSDEEWSFELRENSKSKRTFPANNNYFDSMKELLEFLNL